MKNSIFRILKPHCRNTLIIKRTFYEPFRSQYPVVYDKPIDKQENLTSSQKLRKAYDLFKSDCKLFIREIWDSLSIYPCNFAVNEINAVWKFDGTQKSLDQWIVNSDKDYHHGYSTATLELSSYGTGVFHGILDTRVPKDGRTTNAGYCNITSAPRFKSFARRYYYNWEHYNEVVLRVRGDGRCYMLNILQKGRLDIMQYNCYHYVMYTRGGPYWQIIRVPFSKFVFGSKGQISENQYSICQNYLTNFGITIADKKPGPFRLEIDYIGVRYNTSNFEEFAYETYNVQDVTAKL
ncbi:complex I intermediate-associated protein 30, mitochondrial [Bombus bifarius]|uniref:Complex I intermediate-associated protein 30, mitochondrial n=1 Tax=Bombus bifarius TaxID=103933 RepID=A0A6P8LSP0_9HYME|nr:complex I intermediate-associated protein 30, mitochondrial [Bombus bifarius]